MSALLFKDISRGIPISPLGVVLITNIKLTKIIKIMVSNDYVSIFEIMLYHKINGILLRGPPWQIPIITLCGKKYQFLLNMGSNIKMKVSSWGTNFTPWGKIICNIFRILHIFQIISYLLVLKM
jgi:hypothetical protein